MYQRDRQRLSRAERATDPYRPGERRRRIAQAERGGRASRLRDALPAIRAIRAS